MPAQWPSEAAPIRRLLDLAGALRPVEAAAADAGLTEAMAGIVSSGWPEVAWRFSAINGDGFPVEFTFSSRDGGLRYTAEVDGPEAPEHARILAAFRWARGRDLGARRCARQWQRGDLRWGAWVGGFHLRQQSRRKVYLEAHDGPTPAMAALPLRSSLRFVGLSPGSGEREWYFRRDRLQTSEVGRLLCSLSLRRLFEPLRQAVSATLPWPTREHLVPAEAGFSFGTGPAFSVFTFARRLWGGDGSIRRHLLDLATRRGWDFDLYERVTRPLERSTDYRTCHGVLAWIGVPNQPVELRISVRPPARRECRS